MRWFLIFLIAPINATATVLIQMPSSPPLEYRAALKADPDLKSPTQKLLSLRPGSEPRQKLLAEFAQAQTAYVSGARQEALKQFEILTQSLTTQDWTTADRQIFLHAVLRVAQLQSEPERQRLWLSRALSVGPDVQPQADLFPPPLTKALTELRGQVPLAKIPSAFFEDGWSTVLVNGYVCTKNECLGWPMNGQTARLTFISDMWQPETTLADPSEFRFARTRRLAWANGPCGKAQLSPAAEQLQQPRAFWSEACENPQAELNLKPATPVNELKFPTEPKRPPIYKSKYFWIGLGVAAVATAAYVSSQQKERERREPSTTYGYH